MQLTTIFLGLAASVLADGFLKLDIDRRITKRSSIPLEEVNLSPMWNTFYMVEIEVGTPPQKMKVCLDSGSSDFYVMARSSPEIDKWGHFESKNSSTFVQGSEMLVIVYQEGPNGIYSYGPFGNDTVSLGPYKLEDVTFATVTQTNSEFGILGVSFPSEESATFRYPNLPYLLTQQGYISRPLYSVWLNTQENNGNVLFGAIDEAKLASPLVELDVVSTDLSVNLTSVDVVMGAGKNAGVAASPAGNTIDVNDIIAIDTGTAYFLMTPQLASSIMQKVDPASVFNDDLQGYPVSKDLISEDNYFVFNLQNGKTTVTVPFTDCIFPYTNGSDTTYILSITPYGENVAGDAFMRQVYTVFDLEKRTISFANVTNTQEENIVVQ